jgi:hypothetical protein
MESARVFISAENLLLLTKYKGGDPEIGGNIYSNDATNTNGILQTGLDPGRYPFPRTFSIGISVGF